MAIKSENKTEEAAQNYKEVCEDIIKKVEEDKYVEGYFESKK